MNSILLFSILAMLAVIVLLMILIVDQVRGVHRAIVPDLEEEPQEVETIRAEHRVEGTRPASDIARPEEKPVALPLEDQPDAAFGDLIGKRLWDAMTGKPLPDIDDEKVEDLKPRYHAVLMNHIEELFSEGVSDGELGKAKVAINKRNVTTPQGHVVSWIPQQYADSIYRAGFDSTSSKDPAAQESVKESLSEAIEALRSRTGLVLSVPLPQKLLALTAGGTREPQLEMSKAATASTQPSA
jgi:hypothetical protein